MILFCSILSSRGNLLSPSPLLSDSADYGVPSHPLFPTSLAPLHLCYHPTFHLPQLLQPRLLVFPKPPPPSSAPKSSSAAVAHSRREFGTSSLWRHAARRCASSRSGVSFRVPLPTHFSINWRTYGLFILHCSQCYMGSISSMRLWLVHMKKIIRKSPKDTNFRRAVGTGLTSMRIRCSWCPQWCSQMLHQHCIKMSWPEHYAFYFIFIIY